MRKYKVGDKFVFEITNEYISGDLRPMYQCDNRFPATEDTLDKYKKFDSDEMADNNYNVGYNKGLNELWEAIKTAHCEMTDAKRIRWTGYRYMGDIFNKLTPKQLISNVRDYEQNQEIKIGDECVYKSNNSTNPPFIVTRIYYEEDNGFFDGVFVDGSLIEDGTLSLIKKTGRHFPQIAEVLEQMKGE